MNILIEKFMGEHNNVYGPFADHGAALDHKEYLVAKRERENHPTRHLYTYHTSLMMAPDSATLCGVLDVVSRAKQGIAA